jgi:hypothetical protein
MAQPVAQVIGPARGCYDFGEVFKGCARWGNRVYPIHPPPCSIVVLFVNPLAPLATGADGSAVARS